MVDTYNDVLNYLKELGLEDISKEEKLLLRSKLEGANNPFQIKKELEMLYILNRVLLSSYEKVSLENMYKINDSLDGVIAVKLFMEYQQIKSKCNDRFTCINQFKAVIEEILFNQKKANKEIQKRAKKSMDQSVLLNDALYLTMLDKNKADKLLANCIRRSSNFLANCDKENLRILIECLKKNFKLSDDELVMISSRCATFFASASASKINNLYVMLNEYKDFVKERLDPKKEREALALLNRNFKDVLINSSLIAGADSDKVSETIRFLMGQELGKITHQVGKYSNIKGDFTPAQLAKIYDKSITSLSMGATHIFDFVSNISLVYQDVYGKDLDLDGFINGRNFSGLSRLNKVDFLQGGKAYDILMLLKPFISSENMANLLKNHVAFLSCSVDEVKSGLRSALIESNTPEDLKRNILSKVRNSFDTNNYEFIESDRKKGVYLGSLKKVEVEALKEDEMGEFLSKLGANISEIERWKNNWNKESKEYRYLEIECELEEIIDDLKIVEELTPFSFASVEDLLKENDEVNNLLKQIQERYSKLNLFKLNKRLNTMADETKIRIDAAKEKINQNYDRAITFIHAQSEEVAKELEKTYKIAVDYDKDYSRLELIEKEIEENEIDADAIEAVRIHLDSITQSYRTLISISKRLKEKKEEIVEGIEELKKVFDLKFNEYDEVVDTALSPVMSGHNGDILYHNLLNIYKDEGLLDGFGIDVKEEKGIKTLKAYYTLFEKEEIEIFEYLKKELEEYKSLKDDALFLTIALLEDNDVDCSDIKDIKGAKRAMEALIEEQKRTYESVKNILKERKALEAKIEKIDPEELIKITKELSEKLAAYIESMEDIEKRKNVH